MRTRRPQTGRARVHACHKRSLYNPALAAEVRFLSSPTPSSALADPISGEEIRSLRERSNLSQAAFARLLNLTVGYISQLERGVRKPSGPALTLFNVIRRKGLEVILLP
jgi:putative transcriptional regulator